MAICHCVIIPSRGSLKGLTPVIYRCHSAAEVLSPGLKGNVLAVCQVDIKM